MKIIFYKFRWYANNYYDFGFELSGAVVWMSEVLNLFKFQNGLQHALLEFSCLYFIIPVYGSTICIDNFFGFKIKNTSKLK